MSGFVVIHRSLIGHPDFRNDAEAMAFAWMVIRAAWKPVRVRYKGRSVSLKRGQLCVSQRDMAAALDRDKAWVERLFKRLERQGMVRGEREAAAMLITICNYDKYQDLRGSGEAVDEAVDEADARQTRGTEQRKEPLNHKPEPNGSNNPLPPKPKKQAPIFKLPEWVPVEEWNGYVAMRVAIKKPMTERAKELVIGRLAKLGPDFGRVLDQSTRKNWLDVYALKDENNGGRNNHGNGNSDGGIEPPYNPYLRSAVEWEARQADQFE